MPNHLRLLLTLFTDDGLPRNAVTNTWHFGGSGDIEDDMDTAIAAIETFYQAIDGGLSTHLDNNVGYKFYELLDGVPRIPRRTGVFTISPGTGAQLPNEVACCLSYSAAPEGGAPPGRRRGRIFLGPMNVEIMDTQVGETRIDNDYCNTVKDAAVDLMALGLTESVVWDVFSPTTAGSPPWGALDLGGAFFEVQNVFVDNAFDTIRSRGQGATYRSVGHQGE